MKKPNYKETFSVPFTVVADMFADPDLLNKEIFVIKQKHGFLFDDLVKLTFDVIKREINFSFFPDPPGAYQYHNEVEVKHSLN